MSQIGVTLEPLEFSVKAGSAGTQRFVGVWTNPDGSALPSYTGWTCAIEFISPFTEKVVITLAPAVTGDLGAKTLTFDMVFVEATTAELNPGVYLGDVCMIQPTTGLPFYPANIALTIEPSYAP